MHLLNKRKVNGREIKVGLFELKIISILVPESANTSYLLIIVVLLLAVSPKILTDSIISTLLIAFLKFSIADISKLLSTTSSNLLYLFLIKFLLGIIFSFLILFSTKFLSAISNFIPSSTLCLVVLQTFILLFVISTYLFLLTFFVFACFIDCIRSFRLSKPGSIFNCTIFSIFFLLLSSESVMTIQSFMAAWQQQSW